MTARYCRQLGLVSDEGLTDIERLDITVCEVIELEAKIEPDGDGFHAYVPSLRGCRVGGATKNEAMRNLKDAFHLYIESLLDGCKPKEEE